MAPLDNAPTPHPDDIAIDRTTSAMKAKMAKKRGEGRGGWESIPVWRLSRMLVDHVVKGDPVDIANFAMMLHNRSAAPSVVGDAMANIEIMTQVQAIEDFTENLLRRMPQNCHPQIKTARTVEINEIHLRRLNKPHAQEPTV